MDISLHLLKQLWQEIFTAWFLFIWHVFPDKNFDTLQVTRLPLNGKRSTSSHRRERITRVIFLSPSRRMP